MRTRVLGSQIFSTKVYIQNTLYKILKNIIRVPRILQTEPIFLDIAGKKITIYLNSIN